MQSWSVPPNGSGAPFFRRTDRLRGGLERFVQALLRYRTREKPGFKIFTRERNWDITALLTKCVLTADGFVPRPYGPSLPLPDK